MSKPPSPRHLLLGALLLTAFLAGCKTESKDGSSAAPAGTAAAAASGTAAAAPGAAPQGTASAAPLGSAPPPSPADAAALQAGAVQPPMPEVVIKVENAGAEPKQLLRYRFQKGKTKSFSMKMNLSMNATMDGQPGQPMPPVEFEFGGKSLTVDVAADGTATRQTTFATFTPKMPNLPPQIAAQMEQEMKALEGVQITERISARGQALGIEVNQATIKSPQVQQLLSNLVEGMSNSFLPLPETPVGPGAKWESRTVLQTSGVAVTQIGRFKISSIKGDKLSLDLNIEQLADAKAVPSFPSAPGVMTQLISMDGKGTGLTVVDLGTLDSTGTVQMETKTVTRVTAAGEPSPPPVPGMPAQPAQPPRSATSTLMAKVGVTIKMTD